MRLVGRDEAIYLLTFPIGSDVTDSSCPASAPMRAIHSSADPDDTRSASRPENSTVWGKEIRHCARRGVNVAVIDELPVVVGWEVGIVSDSRPLLRSIRLETKIGAYKNIIIITVCKCGNQD